MAGTKETVQNRGRRDLIELRRLLFLGNRNMPLEISAKMWYIIIL